MREEEGMAKYPRIGNRTKGNPRQTWKLKMCKICKAPTAGKVEIQFTEMRGDDDVLPVCNDCQKGPSKDLLVKLYPDNG